MSERRLQRKCTPEEALKDWYTSLFFNQEKKIAALEILATELLDVWDNLDEGDLMFKIGGIRELIDGIISITKREYKEHERFLTQLEANDWDAK